MKSTWRAEIVLGAWLGGPGCRAEPTTPAATEPSVAVTASPSAVRAKPESARAEPAGDGKEAPTATVPEQGRCNTVQACARRLDEASSREALTAATVALAEMDDPEAIAALRARLGEARFLTRLDELEGSVPRIDNLVQVFRALETHPSSAVATLCLELGRDPEFLAVDERLLPLLRTLAAVRPMTTETVAFFAEQNRRGYGSHNAVLLGRNASPNALASFETLLFAPGAQIEDQVELVHTALLPVRIERAVIDAVSKWLRRRNPRALEVALIETMFDDQPAAWFGKRRAPPRPRPWSEASPEARHKALDLARRARGNPRISEPLRRAIDAAAREIRAADAAGY